uniref:Uncharacterized protein n=1 Tax=Arundo donax TaxID=35708 RepID=A0A0A9CRR0_ARUDO
MKKVMMCCRTMKKAICSKVNQQSTLAMYFLMDLHVLLKFSLLMFGSIRIHVTVHKPVFINRSSNMP